MEKLPHGVIRLAGESMLRRREPGSQTDKLHTHSCVFSIPVPFRGLLVRQTLAANCCIGDSLHSFSSVILSLSLSLVRAACAGPNRAPQQRILSVSCLPLSRPT